MTAADDVRSTGEVAVVACHAPLQAAWGELRSGCAQRVAKALRSGLERHTEALSKSGLDGPPPEAWRARADALLEYRRETAGALLEPVLDIYRNSPPTAEIAVAVDAAVAAAVEATAALPEAVPSEWPPDALAPRPGEGLDRRVRKAVARVFSQARKEGGARTIPVRAVVRRHLREEAIPAADALAEQAVAQWLEWSGALESAWVRWGDRVLPALVDVEQPDDDDPGSVWALIAESAHTLHEELARLTEDVPGEQAEVDAEARFGALRGSLEADLAVAGSLVYRAEEPRGPTPALVRLERRRRAADAWEEGIAARLRAYQALLAVLAGATAVQRRLVWRFREECVKSLRGLPEVGDALDALAATLPADALGSQELERLDGAVTRTIQPALAAVPARGVVAGTVSEGSDAAVEALFAMVRQAPTTLTLHAEHAEPPRGARPADTRTLALQELARQSFDAMRIERIRSSTLGLIEAVDQIRGMLEELPDVFSFARDEAARELEEGEADAGRKARALVGEALGSMAESLRGQLRGLEAAVVEAERRLAAEVSSGSEALLDRVVAGRMQARLFAARSWVANGRAWATEVLGPRLARARRTVTARAEWLRRLLGRGLRRGSEIVAGPSASDTDASHVAHVLARGPQALDGLPLVYQRLFTLEPLTDSALLMGRTDELQRAMTRWARWHDDEGVPLIVRGRPGSGLTSFLHVLGSRIEDDGGSVTRVELSERIVDEGALAGLLGASLSLQGTGSLDQLAEALFDVDQSALPAVVSLDNLEHVYLRGPGGTDLIDRLLTLMSETEPRVFWIAGITTSAWQLIVSAERSAVSQVDQLELEPLDAKLVRQAVEARHRRSGLPVRFEEPATGRRLLRRRLKRIRDPGAYQEALASDYFDQLQRSSSAHLPLALYQWLESADFESAEGVSMRRTRRPDFAILDLLDLEQNFTLKAFLEHRTLSLEEHGRIFRLPRHESYQLFESLRNRSLIEVAEERGGRAPRRSEIGEELRYRVPQLLTGAILAHLRARNIVH